MKVYKGPAAWDQSPAMFIRVIEQKCYLSEGNSHSQKNFNYLSWRENKNNRHWYFTISMNLGGEEEKNYFIQYDIEYCIYFICHGARVHIKSEVWGWMSIS